MSVRSKPQFTQCSSDIVENVVDRYPKSNVAVILNHRAEVVVESENKIQKTKPKSWVKNRIKSIKQSQVALKEIEEKSKHPHSNKRSVSVRIKSVLTLLRKKIT